MARQSRPASSAASVSVFSSNARVHIPDESHPRERRAARGNITDGAPGGAYLDPPLVRDPNRTLGVRRLARAGNARNRRRVAAPRPRRPPRAAVDPRPGERRAAGVRLSAAAAFVFAAAASRGSVRHAKRPRSTLRLAISSTLRSAVGRESGPLVSPSTRLVFLFRRRAGGFPAPGRFGA